ncbi:MULTISPECIES: DUF3159 domain-containing protein [Micrococcaceae]|uniref:DUF3159 domain-containing protein n=1 Tax=Micrococcaceae TaxID=1268 RepID=UPI00160C7371|nr:MULTISPECIES: DUF3159 domain-containing protein [Micrococcaceae]MBB5749134.1 hypothetical protein [Micrococcus sp. TA1]HRO30216.1 DUF3159 domain-containing protein [Citricoccus sp.]HRO94247.1 DUF3159 domain-containing protein [Citricoccus sp.]
MTDPRHPDTPEEDGRPADPVDAALRRVGSMAATTEDGSLDVLATIGGWRGLLESVVPSAVFLVAFITTQHLWGAGIAAVAVAAVFSVVRLAQRQSPVQALAGLAAVALCVVVALNTGEARDYYLWGFLTNAVYILVLTVSVLVRWPLLGLVFGIIRGEGVAWQKDPRRRRRYALATWFLVTALALRLLVQVPLYAAELLTALGTARLVMGLPLYALALWLGWLVSAPAGRSPADEDRLEHPGQGPSAPA